MKRDKSYVLAALCLALCFATAGTRAWAKTEANPEAPSLWTMEDCMRFAAENSYAVKRQRYETASYQADRDQAIASFFPSVSGSIGAQYSFGRSIDPSTNTYSEVGRTFYNTYGLSAALPIFNGGRYVKQWMLASSNLKMGRNEIQRLEAEAAMNAMQAFADAVYYRETARLSELKLHESERNLQKVRREEELGLRGKADVAQFESQVAADDYDLTHQQNLYRTALLTLKQVMNYPAGKELALDSVLPEIPLTAFEEDADMIFERAQTANPSALQAKYRTRAAQLEYKMRIGAMMPNIYVQAGWNTDYIDGYTQSFKKQFRNNMGEYVAVGVNIPIFDGLSRNTALRKSRNDMFIARENENESLRQLRDLIDQALMDCEGYAKEAVQMQRKVESDSLSYRIALRQYEEGLVTPLDVQTRANALLQSQAEFLQRVLMLEMRRRTVNYYKSGSLY
ncbi:MAG: TolC family protein [Bacteroides sp.]|nr:TolC family protein [Ruminococcus flavefaciens]MCM1554046.1 TolC family protein [Bacteroides sp.]